MFPAECTSIHAQMHSKSWVSLISDTSVHTGTQHWLPQKWVSGGHQIVKIKRAYWGLYQHWENESPSTILVSHSPRALWPVRTNDAYGSHIRPHRRVTGAVFMIWRRQISVFTFLSSVTATQLLLRVQLCLTTLIWSKKHPDMLSAILYCSFHMSSYFPFGLKFT